ncbi:LysR family transcriptional regulator [Clostridium cellulovorans]|uniref:Transcriptional regulator, LysR family n=1 Tax=Clostridium cellulovorans (strain ATCC 35296 / DSM 3052 / OCM 3 / 743B) TaxID=573061 RepID=D9SWK6_CLOC7|nr:LysR family transcriptional regulator [Clostridium cellulovorans]ADL53288.1 transcriptional regulator, LysR family [Clostridium cellulovorans 743B]
MTSQQIEYILVLAEERNFSKAAKRLFVTQPSLSQFIRNLEYQLKTVLFDRSTSPLKLTPAGEAFVKAARKIQAIENELNYELADLSDLQVGELTIGTSPFRASFLLTKSIAAFHKKYPRIKLNIITDSINALSNSLLEGNIDICIDTNIFDPKIFQVEILSDETYYLAVPKGHPFNLERENLQLTPEDITYDSDYYYQVDALDLSLCENHPFIIVEPGQSPHNVFIEIFKESNINPNIILYSSQIETAFHWVLSGIAFTFIPDTLIRFGNYADHPVYYKLNNEHATNEIVFASKKNRYLSKAAHEYIVLLKKLIGQGTWL